MISNKTSDKTRAILIGLAVGDALGANLEFGVSSSAEITDEKASNMTDGMWPKGAWTDDTSMALCLGNSLVEQKGYNSFDIMDKFAAWMKDGYCSYDQKPAADVGFRTQEAINDYLTYPTVDLSISRDDNAGNGCIMRLAPTILAACNKNSLEETVKLAWLSGRETHYSELAESATQVFANLLYRALQIQDKKDVVSLENLYFTDEKFQKYWEENAQIVKSRIHGNGEDLKDLGGYVLDAITVAIWAFLKFDNFEDGLIAVLKLGGDTDTNGAIYGQLAGAYYGLSGIPKRWIDDLLKADEIIELADNLAKMKDCPILKTRFEEDPKSNPLKPIR